MIQLVENVLCKLCSKGVIEDKLHCVFFFQNKVIGKFEKKKKVYSTVFCSEFTINKNWKKECDYATKMY